MQRVAQQLFSRYVKTKRSIHQKTWIRSYEPELKRQLSEWHTPSSPRPIKFRGQQRHLKLVMVFAYANKGILASHRVPTGQTINQ